ncbi:hypothetical protein DP107_13495 [Haloglomus irregulare]|uniref:DUF8106 domain-containing protein n=1 Tax=Haloglomus irregulare TaxID=2234134 RepID=A0A554MXY6_9EURY|nr:hypothetical protein [Haloglomus irregulare]TSD09997.1 hypothetical protein DP107_13495 [Haloglomus irregulare]
MSVTSPPVKATLFCPECPHRSHVDGDWVRVEQTDGTRLVCPDCWATVAVRPPAEPSPPTVGR